MRWFNVLSNLAEETGISHQLWIQRGQSRSSTQVSCSYTNTSWLWAGGYATTYNICIGERAQSS